MLYMARTRYTIDAVAVSQEHCASRLLNLVDTKNKSSRRARQLQSIAGGNPPGEAARLICSVPIPLLSSLWIMNGQVSTCGIECDFLDRNQFGQSWARNANNAPRSRLMRMSWRRFLTRKDILCIASQTNMSREKFTKNIRLASRAGYRNLDDTSILEDLLTEGMSTHVVPNIACV